jgi:hypothetical protein
MATNGVKVRASYHIATDAVDITCIMAVQRTINRVTIVSKEDISRCQIGASSINYPINLTAHGVKVGHTGVQEVIPKPM